MLFVDHTTQPSGGQLALFRLVQSMPPEVERVVLAPADGPLHDAYARLPGVTVATWRIGARTARARGRGLPSPLGAVSMVLAIRDAYRSIRSIRPDVVHTNSMKALLAGGIAARLLRLPLVAHVRDRLAPDYLGRAQLVLARTLLRLLPSGIVSNSTTTDGLVPHRDEIPRVVSPSPCVACVERRRERDGQPGRIEIVSLSRLVRWKGQDVALRALARLVERGVDGFHFTIYGAPLLDDDGFATELRSLAAELGVAPFVTFAGHVDDVEAVLVGADVLLHNARLAEPFGQVVVEAMACGLAVVASADGGPAEIVEDGRTGVLVPPGRDDLLADALASLLATPGRIDELGARARTAVEPFRPSAVVPAIVALYGAVQRS